MLQAELSHHRHAAVLSSEQISMHSVLPARGAIFFFVNRKKADCQNAQSSTKSCWEEGVLGLPSCAALWGWGRQDRAPRSRSPARCHRVQTGRSLWGQGVSQSDLLAHRDTKMMGTEVSCEAMGQGCSPAASDVDWNGTK